MPMWPIFDQYVVGLRLFDLIDWVSASNLVLDGGAEQGKMPIIAMPPVQRSAVWRPKAVLDLWDSLLRGLPIGSFYLVDQPIRSRELVRLSTNKTVVFNGAGFDLLDGQQRLRALLVGACGFPEEKRCLWVDLGAETASKSPCLRLTSKAQPFGYDATTGNKLRLYERGDAREKIEPDPEQNPIMCIDEVGTPLRPAYDLDLFDGRISQGGRLIIQPPLPYRASNHTFKLHDLLAVWRKSSETERIDSLLAKTNHAPIETIRRLDSAFVNLERAQVALIRVDPGNFASPRDDLLALFERIGTGGTALSSEERLYSIYKYHAPYIRDAVTEIYDGVGRVLSTTKIAATALRIANARSERGRNYIPNPTDFSAAMSAEPTSLLRQQLEQLIPASADQARANGSRLSRSFKAIKDFLIDPKDGGPFWIPDVLIVSLPAELWQVLVFWFVENPEPPDPQFCRQEVVRLALFWHVFVWNNEKAAAWAFAHIKGASSKNTNFPGFDLYDRFVGQANGESIACGLVSPEEFARRICKPPTAKWRTDAERFVENEKRNDIGSYWWWNSRKILPFLQKDYVSGAFPGYAPLTDHEDDLPYDFDHVCPRDDWRNFGAVVSPSLRTTMRNNRDGVGDSIGNLCIVDSSKNRHHQNADISKKMPCLLAPGDPIGECKRALSDWAFPQEDELREPWRRASCPVPIAERKWTDDRLSAFQEAVERRAAWLYRRFHDDLGYGAWTSERR